MKNIRRASALLTFLSFIIFSCNNKPEGIILVMGKSRSG